MRSPTIAYVFPGTGSQYVGMGKKIYTEFQVARDIFHSANQILGYDISQKCFSGGILELHKTLISLPAIFTVSIACCEVLKLFRNETPKYYAGHSVGEYAALTSSGAISFREGLELVQYRAKLAEEAKKTQPMTMSVVKGVSYKEIENLCNNYADAGMVNVGCYNSQEQVLITGNENAVQNLEREIHKLFPSAQIIPMVSSPAFHSYLLSYQANKLSTRLSECDWRGWNNPVLSNVSSQPYDNKTQAIPYLTEQLYKPVQWVGIMNFLYSQGIETIIEVGPQSILKQLSNNPTIKFYSFDIPADRKILLSNSTL
jgi:[acyl-carrier-protein] S-malonyltransferase